MTYEFYGLGTTLMCNVIRSVVFSVDTSALEKARLSEIAPLPTTNHSREEEYIFLFWIVHNAVAATSSPELSGKIRIHVLLSKPWKVEIYLLQQKSIFPM